MKASALLGVIVVACLGVNVWADDWGTPTYQGLTLGKSTKADAERLFGAPKWSGHPEDEFDNPLESMLSYEYEDIGGFRGRTAIWMERSSGRITEILLSPAYGEPLPAKTVLDKLGTAYIERDSSLGPCPTPAELHRFTAESKRRYPVFVVFPSKGMFVSVQEDGSVLGIVYAVRCSLTACRITAA